MQEKNLFEYAVIRIVPKVEREEFLNAGIILYCRKPAFLQAKVTLDKGRLLALFPDINMDELKLHLQAFEKISNADIQAGPIAGLDMSSRFRWLTAKRSTILQTSKVHPGLCKDPAATLIHLYEQLVICKFN